MKKKSLRARNSKSGRRSLSQSETRKQENGSLQKSLTVRNLKSGKWQLEVSRRQANEDRKLVTCRRRLEIRRILQLVAEGNRRQEIGSLKEKLVALRNSQLVAARKSE